jgi:hypothetical protein
MVHTELQPDDFTYCQQMSKIPDHTCLNYSEFNPRTEDAVNPSSAILSYFQLGEYTYDRSALCTVLMILLNEPCFD